MTVERSVVNVSVQRLDVDESEMFPNYFAPLSIVPDHSLPVELPLATFSPNSLLMYEHESDRQFGGHVCQASASCGGRGIDMAAFGDAFDLNPMMEQSNDLLSLVDDDFGASLWTTEAMKVEDAFVDQKGIMQGPTLAALNDDPSVPSIPSLRWMDDIETVVRGDASFADGSVAGRGMFFGDSEPVVSASLPACFKVTGFKQPQLKQLPCTVTKVSPSAFLPSVSDNPIPMLTISNSPARNVSNNTNFDCKSSSLSQLLSIKKEPDSPLPVAMTTRMATQCPSPQRWGGVRRSLLFPSGDSSHSMDRKWEEIKQFIHDENEQQRFAGVRGAAVMREDAPEDAPLRHVKTEPPETTGAVKEEPEPDHDPFMSDTDDSHDDDFSDTESLASQSSYVDELLVGATSSKTRYFWQYNTQSKGPKGKRLCKGVEVRDPHVLGKFQDPVFDPDLNHMRYKHNGKARRGDGNDVTPNPVKLFRIGNELCRLNNAITDMTPPVELPQGVKSKSRREKNKFASRACRLKKKAQHEANKVKLYGLQREHNQLMTVLESIKTVIVRRVIEKGADDSSLTEDLQSLIDRNLRSMVAGHTTDYVNSVLEHIANGDLTGGLNME